MLHVDGIREAARDALGLSPDEATVLFDAEPFRRGAAPSAADTAAATLRAYAEGNEVRWRRATDAPGEESQ